MRLCARMFHMEQTDAGIQRSKEDARTRLTLG